MLPFVAVCYYATVIGNCIFMLWFPFGISVTMVTNDGLTIGMLLSYHLLRPAGWSLYRAVLIGFSFTIPAA